MSDTEVSSPSDVVEESASPPVTPPDYSTPTGCATVYIDGVDVTNCAVAGSSTRRLNRPSQAQVRLPMDCAIGGVGSHLAIEFGGSVHHSGRVLLCETVADENTGYTTYNSSDPMEMFDKRPARDGPASSDPGDFSNPLMFSGVDFPATGPEIFEQMFLQSEDDSDPEFGEGPLFLTLGTIETGGISLEGAPTDWPMTMAEVCSLMVSTGCLDLVIAPTNSASNMGTISAYNGDYGTDLSGSVVFEYGQGAYNIKGLRWNQDMTQMTNKLWYFMGPRILTPSDPAGNQHWCFNVQGDDPGLPTTFPNGVDRDTWLAGARMASRSAYGVRMDIQIFDAGDCNLGAGGTYETDCCGGSAITAVFREIWRNRWETESYIRAQPRELIHITPTAGTGIGAFDIGDLVGVSATSAVRGGFSGAQRVYEYTISWDDDGVCELAELQTSPTAD